MVQHRGDLAVSHHQDQCVSFIVGVALFGGLALVFIVSLRFICFQLIEAVVILTLMYVGLQRIL